MSLKDFIGKEILLIKGEPYYEFRTNENELVISIPAEIFDDDTNPEKIVIGLMEGKVTFVRFDPKFVNSYTIESIKPIMFNGKLISKKIE